MPRATIQDVARKAGVSVATVNRVLHEPAKVREETKRIVLQAAEEAGFYGMGALRESLRTGRPAVRLGILLSQHHQAFYRNIARALETAAQAVTGHEVHLVIDHLDDLSPQAVADGMMRMAGNAGVLGVVSAEHPVVSGAIETLAERGIRVFALVTPLSARCGVGYAGLDSWKVGRTAAWAFDRICKAPGKIAILVGNHRYRCQEINESGFRSYFREHPRGFELLEPRATFETDSIARDLAEDLLARHHDLAGLFVCGGGLGGALDALRHSGRAREIVTVGYDLTEISRAGLLDGSLDFLISHPLDLLAREAIAAMIRSGTGPPGAVLPAISLPFDIFTPENL